MKKKIFVMATIVILAIVTLLGVNLKAPDALSMFFKNIEAVALAGSDESGGSIYSKGYENDPKECIVTETKACTIPIIIPKLDIYCTINFDYTVETKGTQNYCKYNGGPGGCSYHECKKNK